MSLIAYIKTLWQNGSTPAISATNLNKIEDGIEAVTNEVLSHTADYTTQIPYAVTTGSANTYVASTNPALPALIAGVAITVKFHAANTGASTLNWNGKGAVAIKNPDGTALSSGDLALNGVYTLRYDGVNFILQGKGGVVLTGDFVAGDLLAGKTGYSNDPKTKLTGTMPNRGTFNLGLGVSVPAGYYSGGTTADGKLFASAVNATYTSDGTGKINISGLAFTPSFVIFTLTMYSGGYNHGVTGVITKNDKVYDTSSGKNGYLVLADTDNYGVNSGAAISKGAAYTTSTIVTNGFSVTPRVNWASTNAYTSWWAFS